MVDRKNVHRVVTDEAVDDAIRRMNDLAETGAGKLRNLAPRFRKLDQAVGCDEETADNDIGEVGGVLCDKGANACEITSRALRPEQGSHERNCFLTSSWGVSSPASD